VNTVEPPPISDPAFFKDTCVMLDDHLALARTQVLLAAREPFTVAAGSYVPAHPYALTDSDSIADVGAQRADHPDDLVPRHQGILDKPQELSIIKISL
jgi:hypothetical protein